MRVRWKPAALVVAIISALILVWSMVLSQFGESSTMPESSPLLRQSRDQIERTDATMRRLDDHPLYEMTYYGGYNRSGTTSTDRPARVEPWGCSVFVAAGDASGDRGPVLGRNFDWDDNPAMVVRTDPPDGYASLSVADISYVLGATAPDPRDPKARAKMRYAALLPFDGMNEKGLTVGMASVSTMDGPSGKGRPTVGSVRILRILLDEAATVDEAISIMNRYHVDKEEGPPLHYMIADASGRSAVVELVDGELKVFNGESTWNLMVNFMLSDTKGSSRHDDWRWRTASTVLKRARGKVSGSEAMGLLAKVAQGHTRWSAVYDLGSRTLRLAMGKHYDKVYDFSFETRPTPA